LIVVVVAASATALSLAVVRESHDERPVSPVIDPRAVRRMTVGQGATAATVVVRGALRARRPIVIFLHGWKLVGPRAYRAWVDHLARSGSIVIMPRYQVRNGQDPSEILGNSIAGIRAVLPRLPAPLGPVVAAGHSAGGALAADYAAIAKESRLPVPRAVFAVFPGRAIRAGQGVPVFDPAEIDASTRLVVLTGAQDEIVGSAPGEALVASATSVPAARRRLIAVPAGPASDHFAPVFDRPAVRREIWSRLDALIARIR
jgi:acetyl esterase/lipase